MDEQTRRSFFLVFSVLIFYNDMCTCALVSFGPKKQRGFGGKSRKSFSKKFRERWPEFERNSEDSELALSSDDAPEVEAASFSIGGPFGRRGPFKGRGFLKGRRPGNRLGPFNRPGAVNRRGPFNRRGPLTLRQFVNKLRNNERSSFERLLMKVESKDHNNHAEFERVLGDHENVENQAFLEDLKQEGFNVTNDEEICADWQEYDGSTCVCSDRCEAKSEINMGMVCDANGKNFPNLCIFSYKMCSEQIPSNAELTSCGLCNKMKLTGSNYLPEDRVNGLGIFTRDATGNTWTAIDDHGNQLKLFYSDQSKSWVVGSMDLSRAGIVFNNYTEFPQDLTGGAVVFVNETYNQLDPFLHFECMPDSAAVATSRELERPHSRQKRFGFLIAMVVISIAATTAQVTVTAVQKKKGCLFYPEVCKNKKEIKDQLRPEVESLKRTFNSIIGEPSTFRDLVHNFFQDLLNVKEKMVELRKLEKDFQDLSNKIGPDLKFLAPQIAENFDISFYDQWLKALGQQTAWGIFGLVYVQMPLEMISLMASTASKASMAFAAFGAVISVAAAVVSIVVSWKNEQKQRDQLRKVKRNLLDARQKLKSAISHANAFQVKFYKSVIYPLKKFTHHMRNYDNHFKNFYNHLVRVFGSSMSENVGSSTYGKVTESSIRTLRDQQLTPLISFLGSKMNDLKRKIEAYKQNEKLITLIRNNVNEKLFPKEIYALIRRVDSKLATQLVPTEFSLLKFIAEKVLTTNNCYWGYKLNGVRQGSITSSNYKSVALCNSPELYSIETSIEKLTVENMAPDRITARIQHERFMNKYQKLKYMADYILTSKPCYWGYHLGLIRDNGISVSELNQANPSKPLFTSIKLLPDNIQASALCSTAKICNSRWQTYVKCLLKAFKGDNVCLGSGSC